MTSGNPGREQGRQRRPGQESAPEKGSGLTAGAASHIDVHISTKSPDLCPSATSLKNLVVRVMEGENVPFDSIGIILADHDVVTDLNLRYLDHDWQTDVISFRLSDEEPLEGEVYIDVETARERCAEFGVTPRREILRYAVHGLLHLAGYDDATPQERSRMSTLEDTYLEDDSLAQDPDDA